MRRVSAALCLAVLVPGGIAHAAEANATTLVSAALDGSPVTGRSGPPSVSADGRFVAFGSPGRNLVAGDTNRADDVFVRDVRTGVTTRVSVGTGGVQANGPSGSPSISADGRFVAFSSGATNLVADDTNRGQDVFVHDRETGVTTRVSVGAGGSQGNDESFHPVISADGRFVAYDSYASNLVGNDTNGGYDVFEYDRQSGATIRVSLDSNGREGNGWSMRPSISADGRIVSFESEASNLALFPDTNHATDVFVRDTASGRTDRISVNADGAQGNSASRFATMSADGRYLAYQSYASNLVPGDTNARGDLFLFDRQAFTVTRLNLLPTGEQDPGGGTDGVLPSISADGRYIAFESGADGLVPPDFNGRWDIYVRDRDTATTARVSVASDGTQANSDSMMPSISADGRHVAFASFATNLGVDSSEWSSNVYLRDLGN